MSRPFVYDIGDILIASACLTLAGLAVSILTQQRTSLWQVKKFRLLYSFPLFLILFATNAIIRVITQTYSTMPTAVIIRITSGIMVWVSVVYVIIIYHKLKNLTPREDLESEIILRRNVELELKEREIQLLERTEELEQRNAELERFAYIASHDLAEPLRKVKTFVELLEHKNPSAFVGESGEYLKKIKDANARMGRLMKSILAYSRLTEPEFKPVDLNNLLHAVISDLELLIFDSQAKINILNPLPVIEGAEYQLSQILSNLVSNAIKFSKPDELPYVEISSDMVLGKELSESSRVHLNLDIKQLNEEYYLRLYVKDNGIGFKPDFNERIFQIFERLHGINKFAGTGIGLAIVRKTCELHKGWAWAESSERDGAKFIVILPIRQRRMIGVSWKKDHAS